MVLSPQRAAAPAARALPDRPRHRGAPIPDHGCDPRTFFPSSHDEGEVCGECDVGDVSFCGECDSEVGAAPLRSSSSDEAPPAAAGAGADEGGGIAAKRSEGVVAASPGNPGAGHGASDSTAGPRGAAKTCASADSKIRRTRSGSRVSSSASAETATSSGTLAREVLAPPPIVGRPVVGAVLGEKIDDHCRFALF